MRPACAAGHPATAAAGAEILAEGGSAADAAVAASLASCVAETVMTGLLGGGHAIVYDAASGSARTATAPRWRSTDPGQTGRVASPVRSTSASIASPSASTTRTPLAAVSTRATSPSRSVAPEALWKSLS